jgi:predicted RNase H-like HicB family nuclease
VEAVVGAGEAFVVGHRQLGAKLLIVLADGFEDGALVFGGGIGGDRISKSGWVSNCGLASSPTPRTRAVGFEGFAQLRQLPAAWLQHPARLPHRRRRHHQAARLQVAQLLLMGLKLRVGLGRAAGHGDWRWTEVVCWGQLVFRKVQEFRVSYRIRLLQSDEGWSVSCLDLPGCHSQGDSREEALANIREAITLWLEVEAEEAGVKHVETLELAM